MRAALYGKMFISHVVGVFLFLIFICTVIQGVIPCAEASEGSAAHDGASAAYLLQAKIWKNGQPGTAHSGSEMSGQATAPQQDVYPDENVDPEYELAAGNNGNISPVTSAKLEDGNDGALVIARETVPATPPPDKISLPIDYTTLIAASSTSTPKAAGKNTPAPEPKTSKSSSLSTTAMVAAGAAVAVGVAIAAGGGSSSDSSSSSGSGATPATPSSGNSDIINLAELVRIGDDRDYNSNHPDKFKVSTPSGTSWTGTFPVDNFNSVRSAQFKYTVAASKVGNPVFINGRQAGQLCNPGNTAWNIKSCAIDITGFIHAGANEIKIVCKTDPSDTVSPLDDVELYNMFIELIR